MMASLKRAQSYNAIFLISSRQFSGPKTKRPLAFHHPSWWFMLWCLPPSHSAPCLISLSASGPLRFILLPLPVVFGSFCFCFAELCYSPIYSPSIYFFLFETRSCILQFQILAESELKLTIHFRLRAILLTCGSSADAPVPWQSPRPRL